MPLWLPTRGCNWSVSSVGLRIGVVHVRLLSRRRILPVEIELVHEVSLTDIKEFPAPGFDREAVADLNRIGRPVIKFKGCRCTHRIVQHDTGIIDVQARLPLEDSAVVPDGPERQLS